MAKLMTKWGQTLDKEHPLPEYPRPQLVRNSYLNLNGPWDYAISREYLPPKSMDGKITVPFAPETILSGVQKRIPSEGSLWYRKTFRLPGQFAIPGGRVFLHFGAVDQMADVVMNGTHVYHHDGGYWPFSVDVTDTLIDGRNTLSVRVVDSLEDNPFGYGKQKNHRGGIWYTPVSGIWQTVWMESVPEVYIKNVKITPLFDLDMVQIKVETSKNEPIHVKAIFKGAPMGEGTTDAQGNISLKLKENIPWSPESPMLYDLELDVGNDHVQSYFAMRKFGTTMYRGFRVFALNNQPYFHNGLLDQGYWSDGLYTAPSDEALIHDIQTAKNMGFNMLRKHIKIEPLRWYYHCDRMGMLVWQDMVNGGEEPDALNTMILPFLGKKINDHNSHTAQKNRDLRQSTFLKEVQDTISLLYNSPCVALWTIFNEGWGQFDALRFTEIIRKLDPTRPIDHASGWHDQGGGDVDSHHIYFKKIKLTNDKRRVLALTEFGGYSLPWIEHTFSKATFGYRRYRKVEKLEKDFLKLYANEVIPLIQSQGLSAAVYTQLSDVEDEVNGLMTFDRAVIKIPSDVIAKQMEQLRFDEQEKPTSSGNRR